MHARSVFSSRKGPTPAGKPDAEVFLMEAMSEITVPHCQSTEDCPHERDSRNAIRWMTIFYKSIYSGQNHFSIILIHPCPKTSSLVCTAILVLDLCYFEIRLSESNFLIKNRQYQAWDVIIRKNYQNNIVAMRLNIVHTLYS